jgi:hypothetical protein
VRSHRSLLAVTFLHTLFNTPSLLALQDPVVLNWLSAVASVGIAILTIVVTKGNFEESGRTYDIAKLHRV